MRLSKDTSSYRAQGLKAKLEPVPDVPTFHKKKNTRRWCKGIVGREHEWDIAKIRFHFPADSLFGEGVWFDWYCVKCNKQDYQIVRKLEAN